MSAPAGGPKLRRYVADKRRAILLYLARNYAPSVQDVAKATGMPRTECWSLLWRMHEDGEIMLIRGDVSTVRLPRLMRTG